MSQQRNEEPDSSDTTCENETHESADEQVEVVNRQMYFVQQPETPRMWIRVNINGKSFRGLLDSGAVRNLIHESLLYRMFGYAPVMKNANCVMKGVGEVFGTKPLGQVTGAVDIMGVKLMDSQFLVMPLHLKMNAPLMLGLEFMKGNGLSVFPESRVITNESRGFSWMINEDGRPTDIGLQRSECCLPSGVDIAPRSSISARIALTSQEISPFTVGTGK